MTVHYRGEGVELHHGDCLDVLAALPDNSIDAVVTDPPYGLEFMGKEWDSFGGKRTIFHSWCQQWAAECLRVLNPGGHLAAFGGTRTWHRLAYAIEDAGFEIRDSIAWLYASGFPKSLDVSKAIDKAAGAQRDKVRTRITPRTTAGKGFSNELDESPWLTEARRNGYHEHDSDIAATDAARQWQGWGTALKPAHEPIIIARKPLQGTVAANVLAHGTGGLNIDATRVQYQSDADRDQTRVPNPVQHNDGHAVYQMGTGQGRNGEVFNPATAGRWPPNVVLDETQAAELDKQSGIIKGQVGMSKTVGGHRFIDGDTTTAQKFDYGTADSGGASRFFPTFKYHPKAPTTERPNHDGTAHPTVKPVDLMRWLIRLVTPPGGTVLDPFAGTGTTGEAAIKEHKHAILIECEDTYLPLIVARLSKPMEIGFNFDEESA